MQSTLEELQLHHGPGFGDHGSRVAVLSVAAGRVLGLKEHEIDRLRFSALVHDLGKTEIDTAILEKASPLTDEETAAVQEHPQLGHQQLVDLVHPSVAEAVLCHHERWDGGGYPAGLRKKGIPLMARIIFVADTFDVLTIGRSYRAPLTISQAGEQLSLSGGRQFDPAVVDALASVGLSMLRPVVGVDEL